MAQMPLRGSTIASLHETETTLDQVVSDLGLGEWVGARST
jgi:hypothetical protein